MLFRFFDMLKPWPISWLDKHIHGGTGIMLDDIAAAIPALILLRLMLWAGWL
ncbi:MAG: phosphatidylglycerophosphatase A [Acidithiobacillus sp.]